MERQTTPFCTVLTMSVDTHLSPEESETPSVGLTACVNTFQVTLMDSEV